MMQTLRKKTRLVLFIALAAFGGLIFFQWGLDITGITSRPETNIAKVGNQTISYQEYRRFAIQKEAENKNVTVDEIWMMLLEEVSWRNLQKEERIDINDDEIWAIIKSNPPPEIYQSEFMQDENGQFDWNKYEQLIKSPQSLQWLYQYEMQLRQSLPKEKLRSLISTMAWVSPYEDSMALYLQTAKFDITLLTMHLNDMRGLIDLSDEEVGTYYNVHRDEFATPEYKVLKYVFFERKPSAEDTLEARQRLEDLIVRVEEGEDFLPVAQEVSDDTTVEYTFNNENALKPYMRDVYLKLSNGEMSGIVDAARGFEVMKRIGKGSMEVARVNIEVSRTTISEITDNIASFIETSKDIGFDSAAAELSFTVHRTYPLESEAVNFPVRNVEGLADFVKKVKPDQTSEPFSSLGGYYVFALDSIMPARQPTLEEAFAQVKASAAVKQYESLLEKRLNDMYAQIGTGRSMEEVAASDTIARLHAGLIGQTLFTLRNIHGDEFAGAVASLEPGQVSEPVITKYGGYIIRCDGKEEMAVDSTMIGMLQWTRQVRLQNLSQELFTPERLVDNRDKFFE